MLRRHRRRRRLAAVSPFEASAQLRYLFDEFLDEAGDWSEPQATQLTEASEAFGEVWMDADEDGNGSVWCSQG